VTRNEAIELLVQRDLVGLSRVQREDILLNWWTIDSDDAEYCGLPGALKIELATREEASDPMSPICDPLLKIALEHKYVGVTNSYLTSQITLLEGGDLIEGDVEEMAICPCCGYRTLKSSGHYYICPVCFWEDDGTTEADRHSGPNHMTLSQAQQNFCRFGAVTERSRQLVLPDGRYRYVWAGSV
jgi:hypothetical protein